MSDVRPLPPRPSLEFERKEAKALLRGLRAGNPDAIARVKARHPAVASTPPAEMQLADAQLTIAREYGFASWPRLVKYFENAERLLKRTPSAVNPGLYRPEDYPGTVQNFIDRHRRRSISAARSLVAYVPRFYGMSLEAVFDMPLTEEEARLAVARGNGFVSWDALMARVNAQAKSPIPHSGLEVTPFRKAIGSMKSADLSKLQEVVSAHPELLAPTEHEVATGLHLLSTALNRERDDHANGADPRRMRPIIEWLATVGFDVQLELNIRLCGDTRITPDDVQYWIDRGADPNWVAPNGYSVLEHAIVRYWNPEALDCLARYARVRHPALWIAAGLGDVAGVHRLLDGNGKPTEVGRDNRPQFDVIGPRSFGTVPGDDDDEILAEAAMVAFLNQRTAVMEYLVSRGFPVNTLRWEMPFLVMAVGNNKPEMVEALIRSGADLDLRGAYNGSAREMARSMLESQPHDARRRRIAELCGLDADAIVAAHDAQPLPLPVIGERLRKTLELASDDARRNGRTEVGADNLLFGLLRAASIPRCSTPSIYFAQVSAMDYEQFGKDFADRLRPADAILGGDSLPLDSDARGLVDDTLAVAAGRRREEANGVHLLYVLTRVERGLMSTLLSRYGSSAEKLLAEMERAI